MARATDQQVQVYVDTHVRPRAEQLRAILAGLLDDKAAIDDIYDACSNTPTWSDNRVDGPPTLLAPSDVLAFNAYISALIPHIRDAENYDIILSACVQPVNG